MKLIFFFSRGVRKKKTLESKVTEDELKQALNKDDAESEDEQMKGVDSSEKGLGYGRYKEEEKCFKLRLNTYLNVDRVDLACPQHQQAIWN